MERPKALPAVPRLCELEELRQLVLRSSVRSACSASSPPLAQFAPARLASISQWTQLVLDAARPCLVFQSSIFRLVFQTLLEPDLNDL